MVAKVVIGAGYGDCGKGATVNALVSPDSIVVRHNGGSQAGHTVIHRNMRHVFSHFGSGTLQGAETYLSRFFVSHPLAFLSEWYDLAANGITPRVKVSPDCPVTTIWDIAINRLLEQSRGDGKHGSVGVGFGETLERNQNPAYSLALQDLSHHLLPERLKAIRDEWVPFRCQQMNLEKDKIPPRLFSPKVIRHFTQDCHAFLNRVTVVGDDYLANNVDRLVFEGAQGLLLDQDYGTFPHVTRSNTGCRNVRSLIGDVPIDLHYVTRAYTTKHGAGPLSHELHGPPYAGIRDDTNVPSPFQGSLRFSYLNLDDIKRVIGLDRADARHANSMQIHVTCIDQLPDACCVIRGDRTEPCRTGHLKQVVSETLEIAAC